MKIPVNLKHKPVIACENYSEIDGRAAGPDKTHATGRDTSSEALENETVGLSLGLAQWNDRGKVDISAKVWRHTGEKWSRQSEELPLHRVLDLAILVARTELYFRDAYRFPKLYDENAETIDRVGLQGGAMTVSVCTENPMIDEDIKLFRDALSRDDELLSERLHALARILNEAGYGRNG